MTKVYSIILLALMVAGTTTDAAHKLLFDVDVVGPVATVIGLMEPAVKEKKAAED